MKLFFGLLLMLALWMGSFNQATDVGITDGVKQALRTGSAQQLAAHFDTNIELIIDSEDIEFPSVESTHAEFILKSFFRKYPPRQFQYVYQGTADHQYYSTGTYQTGHEQFQVYVLMRERSVSVRKGSNPVAPANRPSQSQYLISALHFRKVN